MTRLAPKRLRGQSESVWQRLSSPTRLRPGAASQLAQDKDLSSFTRRPSRQKAQAVCHDRYSRPDWFSVPKTRRTEEVNPRI